MWSNPEGSTPQWLKVVRDAAFLVIGAGGIVWQLASGKPDLAVLAFFAGLMYGPNVFAARSSTPPPIDGPASPSPPPSPSPPSSPSTSRGDVSA